MRQVKPLFFWLSRIFQIFYTIVYIFSRKEQGDKITKTVKMIDAVAEKKTDTKRETETETEVYTTAIIINFYVRKIGAYY